MDVLVLNMILAEPFAARRGDFFGPSPQILAAVRFIVSLVFRRSPLLLITY